MAIHTSAGPVDVSKYAAKKAAQQEKVREEIARIKAAEKSEPVPVPVIAQEQPEPVATSVNEPPLVVSPYWEKIGRPLVNDVREYVKTQSGIGDEIFSYGNMADYLFVVWKTQMTADMYANIYQAKDVIVRRRNRRLVEFAADNPVSEKFLEEAFVFFKNMVPSITQEDVNEILLGIIKEIEEKSVFRISLQDLDARWGNGVMRDWFFFKMASIHYEVFQDEGDNFVNLFVDVLCTKMMKSDGTISGILDKESLTNLQSLVARHFSAGLERVTAKQTHQTNQPEVQKETEQMNQQVTQATVAAAPVAVPVTPPPAAVQQLPTGAVSQDAFDQAMVALMAGQTQLEARVANATKFATDIGERFDKFRLGQQLVNKTVDARLTALESQPRTPFQIQTSGSSHSASVFGETMDGVATMVGYGTLGALTGYAVAKGIGILFKDGE